MQQGAHHAHGAEHAAAKIAYGYPSPQRRPILLTGDGHAATHPLGDHIEGRPFGMRPCLAKPGDRAGHDP